ncbi:MAG: dephospho-CoA kinase [Treponema sp.]|nr:dephospho-CoA kinase [Treponema sp.]
MSQVIGIAGKMASGKNYIASQFEKEGWSSIDADLLVHEAINQSSQQIISAFQEPAKKMGLTITNPDKTINRRELGRLLFSDPELLKVQESIVYPIITQMIKDFIKNHEKVIINATVMYKTPEIMELCSKIYYIEAPFFTRLKRARQRDHLPYRQILRRFWAQRNLLKEYKKSDKEIQIIKNS